VSELVKPEDRRTTRARQTEERIVAAARTRFLERGYAGTNLADVAADADVAARTVYVRFGTKAALLKRVVDVALVGDTDPIDVAGRDWYQRSLTAPSLDERIRARAAASARIMTGAADLVAVAMQAEADEPLLKQAHQAGREVTRRLTRTFWTRARDAGLLPDGCDLAWLAETSALLSHMDTYLLMRKTAGWSPKRYERWLVTTLRRLVAASAVQ
jgi:AcrR family transcriptional regulator